MRGGQHHLVVLQGTELYIMSSNTPLSVEVHMATRALPPIEAPSCKSRSHVSLSTVLRKAHTSKSSLGDPGINIQNGHRYRGMPAPIQFVGHHLVK